MLILEGKQAGLSWTTVLSKMETLCEAFDDFDPNIIIKYDDKKVEELLKNEGVIRNKLKIKAVVEDYLVKGKEIAHMAAEEIKNKVAKNTVHVQ